MRLAVAALLLLLAAGAAGARDLPDPALTPGLRNPAVTQKTIKRTICKAGWTATIRPPSSYTRKIKTEQIEQYGYADKAHASYELDHLISLQLGGHPTDRRNLWPQPYKGKCGARIKDVVETRLKRLVCTGQLSLAKAQRMIATNWIAAYKAYVNADGCPDPDETDDADDDD